MSAAGTGVSRCLEPVYQVAAEVADILETKAFGMRIALGVDSAASNDTSELMHSVYLA
jgi:hydroxydechloroatrazine ethylaminohydrolase